MILSQFDHVALLVKSVDSMVLRIDQLGFKRGKVEEFPSEGTKEVYVGNEDYPGRLLLMEPIGEGPYASALAKRNTCRPSMATPMR